MSNKKLHPIYVALDAHQYNRAIKLASALPSSNVLGKALLAHAYTKSGQPYLAKVTLHQILGNFCELKHEVENSIQAFHERQQQSSKSSSQPEPASNSASKKGKKGKRKPAPAKVPQNQPTKNDSPQGDLIDQLNTRPSIPEGWEFPPSDKKVITDETTLATLSVTLQNLKLPLTAYQIYAWAATAEANETILTKTFCLGLTVLAAPSKWTEDSRAKIGIHVLANLQAVALQWARLMVSQQSAQSNFPTMLATAWASQTSLWQLEWLPEDRQRSLILPRLAESMARKLIQQEGEHSPSAEIQLLCLRTLEYQSKWSEMFELLEKLPVPNGDGEQIPTSISSDFGVSFTAYQILTEKARVLTQLEEYEAARQVYVQLLENSPDDWSCWKGFLDCSVKDGKVDLAKDLIQTTLTKQAAVKYPLRGPHLMQVELAAHMVRSNPTSQSLQAFGKAIEEYSQLFAPRAVCTFSDLDTYVDLLISTEIPTKNEVIKTLLKFSSEMRKGNASPEDLGSINNKERQLRLRSYIFAIKLAYKLVSKASEFQDEFMPDLTELVAEWRESMSLSSSNEGEETQKELKPGDDLVLLAVQQLLYKSPNDDGTKVTCAILLESAIKHSPDNAYLKIMAIDVYYQLNAVSRSWEFFQAMGIKHIQLDSCIFPILPFLLEGGLYNEIIELCSALLRFHASTARDCGEYAGRSMEAGTLSKANEFMTFQRQKMTKSLTAVEAKGLILDAAPLLANVVPRRKYGEDPVHKGGLGIHQGIVGGEVDMERATQMVYEVHSPDAAFSLVSWADNGASVAESEDLSDNRDLSILFHQILYKTRIFTKESIIRNAIRRGHFHGILIRATLCCDAVKGPKKGKVVKTSEELEKRTYNLLSGVEATATFLDNHELAEGSIGLGCKALGHATLDLCRVLARINAGLPKLDNDTLEQREKHAFEMLQEKAVLHLKEARENLSAATVKDVCSILPNYVVPLFGIFKMCSNSCTIFGWGKRKRNTKRCAGALADVSIEFNGIIDQFMSSLKSLPSPESAFDADFEIKEEHRKLLNEESLREFIELLNQARSKTRLRVEPVFQEIDEFLDSFDVTDS